MTQETKQDKKPHLLAPQTQKSRLFSLPLPVFVGIVLGFVSEKDLFTLMQVSQEEAVLAKDEKVWNDRIKKDLLEIIFTNEEKENLLPPHVIYRNLRAYNELDPDSQGFYQLVDDTIFKNKIK